MPEVDLKVPEVVREKLAVRCPAAMFPASLVMTNIAMVSITFFLMGFIGIHGDSW